jgi:hypothetical protein
MANVVRIIMILLSLALTVGATAQTAAAAGMQIAMSVDTPMNRDGCSACQPESAGKAASCDLVCSAPAFAILPDEGAGALVQVRAVAVRQANTVLRGLATGLDPSPPRTIILG